MASSPKKLSEYHWTIKGSIVAVFVAAFSFLNLILSIDWVAYSINYNWLFLLFAAIGFFIVCSVMYLISLHDEY